jgi:predicted nucleotidyltransferase
MARQVFERHRDDVRRVVGKHGLANPRVFGSVARGDDQDSSDIDLMVDVGPTTTGFALGSAYMELRDLLGVPLDLITSRQVPPGARERVFAEAVPV